MPSDEPEKGDKVSWQWGGAAPGGEVAEKKTEGQIAIKSHRGNTIKKNASPDNPAVHVKRSGNDVVKRASELNVEKKGSGGGGGPKRNKEEDEDEDEDEDEEKETDGDDGKGGLEITDEGKEVKPGGKAQSGKGAAAGNKKQKTNGAKDTKDGKQVNGEAKGKKELTAQKSAAGAGSKKGKAQKDSKPREEGGVSARTRSRAK